jgi:hypothetical protein
MFDSEVQELPKPARALVAQIEALLDQAEQLLADPASAAPDAAYGIQTARREYLPETVRRYLAVPLPLRAVADESGRSPDALLSEQLSILLRGVGKNLDTLAAASRSAQEQQGRFLRARFDDTSSEVVAVDESQLPPSKRFFTQIAGARGNDRTMIEAAAQKFSSAFPQFTRLERGGMLGLGSVKAVHVTIPSPDGNALRYTLTQQLDIVRAGCTRIVQNVPLKTVAVALDDWFESLYEELETYAQRHADVLRSLNALIQKERS